MTVQISDTLVYKDVNYSMTTTAPLKRYLDLIETRLVANPNNTALLRGYYGCWEINSLGELHLTHLQGMLHLYNECMFKIGRIFLRKELRNGNMTQKEYTSQLRTIKQACYFEQPATLESLFGTTEPVFANWYSGEIHLEYGDLINDLGFMSVYAHTKIFYLEHGILIKEIDLNA